MRITVLPITDTSIDIVADVLAFSADRPDDRLTVIASTFTDVTVHGLRFTPDIDACLLPPGTAQPGGAVEELAAYHVDAEWFPMTEASLAAAVLRTRLLALGYPMSQVVQAMASRFSPGFTLLPASDDSVETLVVVEREGQEEAWPARRFRAVPPQPVTRVVRTGLDRATAAPGVLRALRQTDAIIVRADEYAALDTVPFLELPGVLDALTGTRATVLVSGGEHLPDDLRTRLGGRPITGGVAEALATVGPAAPAGTSVWDRP
ncbi:2-phospho-L-lactate transferase CofD family protein [Brevibacterium ihuae]|uniref:2-phospho-L-lactate transferase CofD family protein n=1 Tax=Brevibacterium ihuae TaxID=1631743 RepID=UPI000C775F36|nr:2-phospho-L-lactate transferase CofD family protein [Brevibacterium ihuae]